VPGIPLRDFVVGPGTTLGEKATFIIQSSDGVGAAFLVDEQVGLTAAHVLGDGDFVRVLNPRGDDEVLTARVVFRDESDDLAVLYFQRPPGPEPLLLTEDATIGEEVVAIGAPGGVLTSTKGELLQINEEYLRADTRVSEGNSGGPLLNSEGEVVGLVTQLEASTNFAIARPASELAEILTEASTYENPQQDVSEFPFAVVAVMLVALVASLVLALVTRIVMARKRRRRLIRIEID